MNTKPLNIAIVGLGRLGKKHALQLTGKTASCKVVAVCSPITEELQWAKNTLGVEKLYNSYIEVLADSDIQAVVLVTPTSLHAEQIIAGLSAGKHVFCEKPLALNIEDCEKVIKVAQKHPLQIAMVGFVRRFDPSMSNALEHIRQGLIGSPFLIRSQNCDLADPSGFFVKFSQTSGGIYLDCTVHCIDLARMFLGAPKAVRAFASGTNAIHTELEKYGDVDNGLAIVEFAGGARAVFYASRTYSVGNETMIEIIGTKGKLLVGAGANRDRVEIGDSNGFRHLAVKDFYERFEEAFAVEMQTFVDACLNKKTLPFTLDDATEATRIALAITKSLRSGMPELI